MEGKIREVLLSIGFKDNEIKVYLDLVKFGSSSALDISRRVKIHRTNVYDVLRNLEKKGFLREVFDSSKKTFRAINPEKLKDFVEQRKIELEQIIPEIKKIGGKNIVKEEISISQGVFAAREALKDLLSVEDTIYVYGAPKAAIDIFGLGFLGEFHKKRIKSKIEMPHIYNQNAKERIAKLNKMKYTEARHLSKKYDSEATTIVCGDFVVIIIFTKQPSIIKIENKEIAKTYYRYFQILWKTAKKN